MLKIWPRVSILWNNFSRDFLMKGLDLKTDLVSTFKLSVEYLDHVQKLHYLANLFS